MSNHTKTYKTVNDNIIIADFIDLRREGFRDSNGSPYKVQWGAKNLNRLTVEPECKFNARVKKCKWEEVK